MWVGRQREGSVLRVAVDSVSRGEGSVVWIEGEPGIGKSALVAAGLESARTAGLNVFWGAADQLSEQLPLRVVLDCLLVRRGSADPRRSAIADYLRQQPSGPLAINDVVYAAAEMALALVDELCAASPTVIVVDDIQWADEASLAVWHRLSLAVSQLPLLLIGTCHPLSRRPSVQALRSGVLRRGGELITVGPLGDAEVNALVTAMVGGVPHESVRAWVASAMGNPLFLRELVVALGRDRILGSGSAEAGWLGERTDIPQSFAAALTDRLNVVPTTTLEMLRTATLLGREFAVTDLAVLLRRPAFDLTIEVQDALTAGIIAEVESHLAFRHPLVRQVLYEGVPMAMRAALHQDAAQMLAAANTDPLVVAQQLSAAGRCGGSWARRWLIDSAPLLAMRAPELAVELLQRELDEAPVHDGEWALLTVALARILLELGRNAEGVTRARQALVVTLDPASRGELQWLLARSLFSMGNNEQAVETVGHALRQANLPGVWRARLLALQAMYMRVYTGDLDAADATARQALEAGKEAVDTFATAYALVSLWLTHSVRRDHLTALDCIDRALGALGDGPDHADLRTLLLDSRIFTMQNLDRWPDATATLRKARQLAQRDDPRRATPSITAAVLMYWLGGWDDALAELLSINEELAEFTYFGLRERGPALLWHGVGALIAARRSDRRAAAQYLSAGLALPILVPADRENSDFLIAAHAVVAERDGDPMRALSILSPFLGRRPAEMTLVHQWLPDIVRLALAIGDRPTAQVALAACEAEAAAETAPARATAASSRCAGLFNREPSDLREAVAHYRAVGPAVDLAGALEDLAAVLADRGEADEAKTVLNEAVDRYGALGAAWDISRAEGRLRAFGIRRGVHGPRRPHASSGWEALTLTELKIANHIARGESTPKIAQEMYLSRRTVQSHISHILRKLGVNSRVDIAREALSRGTGDPLQEAN